MNLAEMIHPPPLFVEIGPDRLNARREGRAMALPIERTPDGRLAAKSRESVVTALKQFLQAKNWQPRPRAWCAIGTRGVSWRRLTLPGGTPEEFQNRLHLQVEAVFPLPPEALAWGYQPLGAPASGENASGAQNVLLAAVKRELVAEYDELLRACGVDPVFVPAPLARWNACGRPAGTFALLDVRASQSELTRFDDAIPTGSRIIFLGRQNASGDAAAADALAASLPTDLAGMKVYLGGDSLSKEFVGRLAQSLGGGRGAQLVEINAGHDGSPALDGLEKLASQPEPAAPVMRLGSAAAPVNRFAAVEWKPWAARLALLLLAVFTLPYAEAMMLRPHLERKVAAFKQDAERLTVIDRELDFLSGLKQSQPPYLDLLYVLSKSVPPGTRFDSLSLNSHGEVALRTIFHDGQQVADFRDKLVASGFFTNVVVEEQSPTPDRQRVNVRMTAQEKPTPQLLALAATLRVDEPKPVAPGASPMTAGPQPNRPVPQPVMPGMPPATAPGRNAP
jgi:hypothetical protein